MREVVGNVLVLCSGLALLASATSKLAARRIAAQLEGHGFVGHVKLIAGGEAISALLLLFPPTRAIGLVLVSALLGGAIATHMQHRLSYVAPALFLALVWLSVWLRNPIALWSLGSHP